MKCSIKLKRLLKSFLTAILVCCLISMSVQIAFSFDVSVLVSDLTVNDVELIDGISGSYVTDIDKKTGKKIEWFKYDYASKVSFTVTLIDGTVLNSYPDGSIELFDDWYFIEFKDDQSYFNEWDAGTHQVTATILNHSYVFNINILDSPVTDIIMDDVYVVEKANGSYTTDYDEDNDIHSPEWYCYNYSIPSYSVVLNDGSIIDSDDNGCIFLDNDSYNIHISDDQCYDNHWELGVHKAFAEVAGFEKSFNVNIISSPIVDMQINDVERIVNTGSYTTNDDEQSWYHYNYNTSNVVVTLNDGTSIESDGNKFIYLGQCYNINISDDQSADNEWLLGAHTAYAELMNTSVEFTVNIVESPVQSIDLDDLYIAEGLDGFYVFDLETMSVWYRYYYSHNSLCINLKDGSKLDSDEYFSNLAGVPFVYYNGQQYEFAYEDNQSSTNQWSFGSYEVKASVMGFDTTFIVYVSHEEDPETLCYGDVDYDGSVSVLDATEIQKFIVMFTIPDDTQKILADVNLDNSINIIDATMVLKYVAELDDTGLAGILAIV